MLLCFLLFLNFSFYVVEQLRLGNNVTVACQNAIERIKEFYPNFSGAVFGVTKTGEHGKLKEYVCSFDE